MRKHKSAIMFGLAVFLLAVVLVSVSIGPVKITVPEIIKMLLHKVGIYSNTAGWQAAQESILFQVRLPRVLGAVLVGAALSTAGALFQGLFRNPMADPYIIGTAAGAAFGATLAMLLPLSLVFYGFGLVPMAAFLGALGSVLLVYRLARFGGKAPIISMLLAGFVTSSFLVAIVMLLLTMSDRLGLRIQQVFSFLMGGISVTYWQQIAVISPLVVLGIVAAMFFAVHLNAFSIGEEGAAYLGIDVEREKMIILGIGALLTACAVSIGGLIGFVGLIIPHAVEGWEYWVRGETRLFVSGIRINRRRFAGDCRLAGAHAAEPRRNSGRGADRAHRRSFLPLFVKALQEGICVLKRMTCG